MAKNKCGNLLSGDLDVIAELLRGTYADGIGVNPDRGESFPRRSEVIEVTELLLELIFPGFDRVDNCNLSTEALLREVYDRLLDLICRAMRSADRTTVCECGRECRCRPDDRCSEAALALLKALPALRETVKKDVAAGYAGDPAATSFDEVVLSYPGLKAITVQRLAHVLYVEKVPLLPRMMTEFVHAQTGIDIHPGAKLGEGIFIDHGTGVVIGETAVLGDNIRIYQGVTLGAGNFPKDACGMLIKGLKRHPTIGNNVTIYSGASVLGDVTIGDNSVIGGNVWLTESLPAGTKITARPPENKLRFASEK